MNSWKSKYYVSLLGVFILIIVFYFLGIQKTIDSYSQMSSIKSQELNEENVFQLNKKLSLENEQLLKLISDKDESMVSSELLKFINEKMNRYNFRLIEYNDPELLENKLYNVYQTEFVISAGFKNTLRFINSLERNPDLGSIQGLNFEKKSSKNSSQLHTHIIFQTLSSK